ncbi:MAG: disulfide bond formation protein B [Candidatus Binatia bacterium]|nr:disulfide bond formation protein B [Candidatus Binatia bacterium]MDG2008823.1 disulfide bond formation protein B [Candidatus Binatia bacterium]
MMSISFARNLNAIAAILLCGVLGGAFAAQFIGQEMPCPLCLLQRIAMLGVATGALINVRFGPSTGGYGVSLLSALFGACVSARQILLHILPGDPGYGVPVFGMQLYTWALVVFLITLLLGSAMLLPASQFREPPRPRPLSSLHKLAFFLVLVIAAGNALATFAECGPGICPANPASYRLLDNS